VVVPSRIEAFGIVVLEAWRSGRPLVATTGGGPSGLVTDGVDGILVDPMDTTALAKALSRVLGDPSLQDRLAARGRETVERYTWGATAGQYLSLYPRARSKAE